MKERNDPAKLPEEERGMVSEETHAPAADGQTAGEQTASAEEATEKLPLVFQISKRQEDGTWKPQPVAITEAGEKEADSKPMDSIESPAEEEPAHREKVPMRAKTLRVSRIVVGTVVSVAILALSGLSIYTYKYPGIFHGVKLDSTYSLSGMTQEQAAQFIASDCQDTILDKNITVIGDDKEFALHVADVAEQVDSEATAEAAYQIGREGGYFRRMGDVVLALVGQKDVSASVTVKETELEEFVETVHEEVEYDPVQPSFEVDKSAAVMTIDTGKPGLDFEQSAVLDALKQRIRTMDCEPYTVETFVVEQEKPDAKQMAEDASCKAEDAKVDTETGEVINSVKGVAVTAEAISEAIGDASEQTYTVPVEITSADLSAKKLKKVLFRDVLAQTTTYYSSDPGRTTNVRLTAESCDGVILNPGDEFSYNDIVGERTPERGYQKATIFVSGESVEDYGGGACQSSSTIYMAVLRADLEVTERRSHQFQITYTPISQDATVAWGSQDFKFVNDTDYPIKISMDMGGGALTCTIYGTKTVDKTVEFSSTSYVSGNYRHATLYKTVTVNGESETTQENTSTYRLGGH